MATNKENYNFFQLNLDIFVINMSPFEEINFSLCSFANMKYEVFLIDNIQAKLYKIRHLYTVDICMSISFVYIEYLLMNTFKIV